MTPEDEKVGHQHIDVQLPGDLYGRAFNEVYQRSDGSLWISNGEYASMVNFCPVCGFKAVEPDDA